MVLFVLAYAIAEVILLPAASATVLAGSVYGLALGSALVVLGASLGAIAVFLLRSLRKNRPNGRIFPS